MQATKKSPKTVLDMIIHAIRVQPANANGVSRTAITKYLKSEFQYEKATQIKNSLKKAIEKGKLIQTGQSFLVAGDPIPERPVEPKVKIDDTKEGSGPVAEAGDTVVVKYEGKLNDGTVFDSASSFEFTLGAGDVIKGWDQGIAGMKVGGKRKLHVPSMLGYGKRGSAPDIPGSADLHFKVTLKGIK
jgi:FKBP-type peptidyl-prolyl cis-trans isomerase